MLTSSEVRTIRGRRQADAQIGAGIRELCRAANVRPRSLADRLGVTEDQITRRLKRGPWYVSDMPIIAQAVGVPVLDVVEVALRYMAGDPIAVADSPENTRASA